MNPRTNRGWAVSTLVALWVWGLAAMAHAQSSPANRWWSEVVESRLAESGANRAEVLKALTEVPSPQREGMAFLVENMPAADLVTLTAAFLMENVELAYAGWEKSPWHTKVPKELFLNEILPYACLNEARDAWRAKLRETCVPLVADCQSPGEAARRLNQKLFPLLKVRYSTTRRRPDQSPSESIQSGIATCTGLSILLVDACRSVGIPARVAGTPMWSNLRGNHTWVEVWDGDWHFAGAAEPDPAGLDRAWFVHDASQAQREVPRHAIYATSFRRTGVWFPLVWRPGDRSVSAVNITDRYTPQSPPATTHTVRLSVKVTEANGRRAVAMIQVTDVAAPQTTFTDQSRGESADGNDFAAFPLALGRAYRLVAQLDGRTAETNVTLTEGATPLVTLRLSEKPRPPPPVSPVSPPPTQPLPVKDAARLKQALSNYFVASPARQATWKFPARFEKRLQENEPAVRQAAWEAYRGAPIHTNLKADFDARVVRFEAHLSPYTVKLVGTRPPQGWALFIALHGGGNAPKEVNDRQWRQMGSYYREHPEAGGYRYLALRAPNDTWNGFYDHYVYPLIDNLLRQFRLFGDIDPDKVFLLGYSHGGYGAYAIGPKMPDRFAAIHASAAAATDGETTGKTLRTTPFTAMVGERDTMYGRFARNVGFKEAIEQLRGGRTDIYPVTVTLIPGHGHTGLPDRDKVVDLYPAVRNPVPRELDWLMTDAVVADFFWLRVPQPAKGQEILASCQDNRFVVTANEAVSSVTVGMDTRLVDFRKPVDIELNGSTVTRRFAPRLKTLCDSLVRRGDPGYAFSAEFSVVKDLDAGGLTVAPAVP